MPFVRKVHKYQRFMPKKETEEPGNFMRIQGEAMGHFQWGLSNGWGTQTLFYPKLPTTSPSSFSPLDEVIGRYRLPKPPTLYLTLMCTHLLLCKRKKKKLFLILLSLFSCSRFRNLTQPWLSNSLC